jgi:signal transduction histidine kinase
MNQAQKLGAAIRRSKRLWVWKLFWIFFLVNLVFFSAAAYQMGGTDLLFDFERLYEEFAFLYQPVFAIQAIILLWQLLVGTWQIRRRVKPLYEMAETADKLSAAVRRGEKKYQNLETAISQISPTRADRLDTGDNDLAGLEQAVNTLLEQMRENYRQQARFASDASHEPRTPIAVIQGYVNMLDRWGKEDERVLAESIAAIQSESVHMQRLVEQLLFLARGDIGKIQLERAQVDLTAMMKEVHDESVMIDSDHAYHLSAPGEPVMAVGDPGLLKQVARILTDNAAKYSPAGSKITLKAGRDPAGTAFFQVQDEGSGMSREDVPHIFERFYRSDSSRTKSTGGSGLGLSIAKWIIDKHGGHLDVLTWEGLGARITVHLGGDITSYGP